MTLATSMQTISRNLQSVIIPNLKHSQRVYEQVLGEHTDQQVRWLDLGCGRRVFFPWRVQQELEVVRRCKLVVGLDLDLPSLLDHRSIPLRVAGDISQLPFRDCSFDLVTANMVVEHLDRPDAQFREVRRVLRPGGIFILHTPNSWGYATMAARLIPECLKKKLIWLLQDREEQDVFKTFYRANTRKGIDAIAKATDFRVRRAQMLASGAQTLAIPPLVFFELLWLKLLMSDMLAPLRTDMIVILERQDGRP